VVEEAEPGEDQEATTVFAAAQIIDLGFLPLPTEIKAMGRREAGYLRFELWDDVASVVGLYEPTFIQDGWQNDADHEHTDETSAVRTFRKDGFVVSMSVGNAGESTTVTFVNHGDVDLRTLPQTMDAEPLSQLPHSWGYVSSSAVDDVADFTRQELAAQGWQENTLQGTASDDAAGMQRLMFVQNGLELSALIGVAPDQGEKTAVQYSTALLPLDFPVYDEALGLEFGRQPAHLSYRSTAGIDTLTDFYLAEMSALGWTEVPESAKVAPEKVTLTFVGQKFYANDSEDLTALLELALVDGQTKVTLRQVDADAPVP
jgi:hypothetical protein